METISSKQCLWTCWTDSHAIIKFVDTQRVTVAIPTIENCIYIEFLCGVGTFLHSSLLVIRRPSETFCSSWVCKHHGNDKLHGSSQYQYKAKNHKTWHFDLWSSLIKHLPRPSESTSLKARMNKEPHGPSPLEPRMRNQMGHSIENTFMMYPLRDLKLSNWQWYIPNDSTKCFIPTLIGVSVIVTHSINMYQQFAGRWR